MDIADPIEAGPGICLYTQEFYQLVKRKLNPGGVFVTQSGPGGLLNHTECFTAIHNTLESEFEHVIPYIAGELGETRRRRRRRRRRRERGGGGRGGGRGARRPPIHLLTPTDVPSFGCAWAWNMAFDATGVEGSSLSQEEAAAAAKSFKEMPEENADARLAVSADAVSASSATVTAAVIVRKPTPPQHHPCRPPPLRRLPPPSHIPHPLHRPACRTTN